jgi:hypothetical protein
MKYEDILAAFQRTSGFDLYRRQAMLDRVRVDPKWIAFVKQQLHLGQQITFFNASTNREHATEFRCKEVLVRLQEDPQLYWGIPYVAINLDGTDVKIRESGRTGQSRHEVAVSETPPVSG